MFPCLNIGICCGCQPSSNPPTPHPVHTHKKKTHVQDLNKGRAALQKMCLAAGAPAPSKTQPPRSTHECKAPPRGGCTAEAVPGSSKGAKPV
eukprot:1161664-Pelagomonas_calceolata.AAC.15